MSNINPTVKGAFAVGRGGGYTVQTVGPDGYVLAADSLQTSGLKWTSDPVSNTLTVNQNISVWAGQGGGWHDIVGVPQTRTTGGLIPNLAQVGATIFWAHQFAINDEMWFAYHILHDFVAGSAVYCHVHWFPVGTSTNSVKWEFSIAVAKGHQQVAGSVFNLSSPTIVTMEQIPDGTSLKHYIGEVSDANAFSSTSLEPDSIMWVRIRRVTNGGTDNANPIFLLLSDCHYKSNGSPTKNKAPDFYL